jgi:hypothetical protein
MDFFGTQDPSYNDTKMLLKVAFDKTAFVKFNINNNMKQNIDETHSKQPKIHRKSHTSLWILEIYRKSMAQPIGFLFLVISASGLDSTFYKKKSGQNCCTLLKIYSG